MQVAHTVKPELAKLSVYARANLAEDGTLKPGHLPASLGDKAGVPCFVLRMSTPEEIHCQMYPL